MVLLSMVTVLPSFLPFRRFTVRLDNEKDTETRFVIFLQPSGLNK